MTSISNDLTFLMLCRPANIWKEAATRQETEHPSHLIKGQPRRAVRPQTTPPRSAHRPASRPGPDAALPSAGPWPGPPPRPRPRRLPRLSRPEFQENAGAPRPAPAEFRAAAATPETLGGRAAPWSQGGPSAATGRARSGLTPERAGPPDSTPRPRPAGPRLGVILPPFREPFPPGPLSPELTSRLRARSLRFGSSSGSGAPDRSDSLTAALRSATELRAPPSRRPDQQWAVPHRRQVSIGQGSGGRFPQTGALRAVSCRVSSPCRAPTDSLPALSSVFLSILRPVEVPPSNSARRKEGLLSLLESAMTVLILRKDKRNGRLGLDPSDEPTHIPHLGKRQCTGHQIFRKLFFFNRLT
uniref:translation initiation factor IF-2-like n=1 Tax=Arvicanthis niloticus TaxID=61156 RepID=UPI0014865648|nr:translation initiation factor IF-2-like [Arvicanthis niloticus]